MNNTRDLTSVVRAMVDAVAVENLKALQNAHRSASAFHLAVAHALKSKQEDLPVSLSVSINDAADALNDVPIKWLAGMGVDIDAK